MACTSSALLGVSPPGARQVPLLHAPPGARQVLAALLDQGIGTPWSPFQVSSQSASFCPSLLWSRLPCSVRSSASGPMLASPAQGIGTPWAPFQVSWQKCDLPTFHADGVAPIFCHGLGLHVLVKVLACKQCSVPTAESPPRLTEHHWPSKARSVSEAHASMARHIIPNSCLPCRWGMFV